MESVHACALAQPEDARDKASVRPLETPDRCEYISNGWRSVPLNYQMHDQRVHQSEMERLSTHLRVSGDLPINSARGIRAPVARPSILRPLQMPRDSWHRRGRRPQRIPRARWSPPAAVLAFL